MRRRPHPILLSSILFGAALAQAVALVVIYRFFVLTEHGQRLDTIALSSNGLAADHLGHPINVLLNAISIVAVAAAAAVVGFIALVRRRVALAVTSIVLIAGANLTAELMKKYLHRPDLGIDEARAAAGNSFPSGHTAIAMSVVVALVLVLPPRVRGAGAIIGAIYAAAIGVATLSAGWHRPSDAVGAILVVGVWAALAGILLRYLRRRRERVVEAESHKVAWWTMAALGTVAFIVAAVGLRLTNDVIGAANDVLSQKRQVVAYLGSGAGILATASFVMAIVVLTVHHVVPHRLDPAPPPRVRAASRTRAEA